MPAQAESIQLVISQKIGQARDAGVHLGPAQLFVGRFLAGGHLHQRRAAEKYLGSAAYKDRVIAHGRVVRAAGRGVAKHQRDRRNAGGRKLRQVAEHRAAGNEDFSLPRQVGPARLDQKDHGQPILPGDRQRRNDLASE